jgi:cholest-4-en-3-one 26-monooxygenase
MDFASIIGAMEVEGRPLTGEEVRWFCFLFFTGGLETTRNATAVGLWQFMENPDQAQIVRDNPDALKGAVEEVLRWVTPSKNRLRVATEDVEVGSKTIKKGDWLVTWLVSANRDEDVFDRPDAFDVTRDPNPHLGFGIGEHLCLGRYLARLELGVILSGVLNGLPDMKAAAAPVWVESNNHTAFRSLPVTFTPTLVHA